MNFLASSQGFILEQIIVAIVVITIICFVMYKLDVFSYIKYLINLIRGTAKLADERDTSCVVVGMQNSSTYGSCSGSKLDSDNMCNVLSRYGNTKLLQSKQATRSTVISALDNALKKKLCVFYYSGHGGQEKNSKGVDGMAEFLCLNDGPLYDFEIWNYIQSAKGRVVMIFDCCHSATMYREIPGEKTVTHLKNTGFSFKMLKSAIASTSKNILVWAGCPSDSYSYGGMDGGVFTNGILKNLDKDDTYDDVWDRAYKYAKDQNPVRTTIGTGFDGKVFR
jgi:hypothetical protein